VVRCCAWSRNLKNEEAMTRVGSQRHNKKKSIIRIAHNGIGGVPFEQQLSICSKLIVGQGEFKIMWKL